MAEIEHFVDPKDKSHPKFKQYWDLKLPLLTIDQQNKNLEPLKDVTAKEAIKLGLINNETLAYFICRTFLFFQELGINQEGIRFRQHL